MEEIPIDFYIDINPNNTIELITDEKAIEFNYAIDKIREDSIVPLSNQNQSTSVNEINKYFNIIFPKKASNDNLKLSLSFAKSFCIKTPLNKKLIEPCISYFLLNISSRNDNNKTFQLTNENIINLGKILMYAYNKKLSKTKIKTSNMLNSSILDIKKKQMNIINQNCEFNNGELMLSYFKAFRRSKDNTVYPPAEMIFLINILDSITQLEFELDKMDKATFDYYIIVALNIEYIFQSVDSVDITITHDRLLKMLYYRYAKDMNTVEYQCDKNIKKTNFNYPMVFKKRTDFNANYYDVREEIDFNKTYGNTYDIRGHFSRTTTFISNSSGGDNEYVQIDYPSDETQSVRHYMEILKQYQIGFEYLIISIDIITQLKTIKTLSLAISELFNQEIIKIMNKVYQIRFNSFNLFDPFSNIYNLKELNIEFNSLDYIGFHNINKLIINNLELDKLSLSLFLPEAHYSPVGLFKLLLSIDLNWKILFRQNKTLLNNNTQDDDVDNMIVKHLLLNYTKNFSFLFWIIKKKKLLKELSVVVISPCILLNNDKYSSLLLKFILNILLLINEEDSHFQKVKLISPFLKLDNRINAYINDFFELIGLNQLNHQLKQLSIQMQLYDVVNIGNLLSHSLIYLYIGDFDIITFEHFTKSISKEVFASKSQLKIIEIGLLPTVSNYYSIKTSLLTMMQIGIKSLERLEVRTNIVITIKQFEDMIVSMHYCFIKELRFGFGVKSHDIIEKSKDATTYYYYNALNEIMPWLNMMTKVFRYQSNILQCLLQYLFKKCKGEIKINYK